MTKPQTLEEFLQKLSEQNTVHTRIAIKIHETIRALHPLATAEIKYGGMMYSIGCGVFVYEKHTSLEFSKGTILEDEYKLLRGEGKYRRHLKFSTLSQVSDQVLHYYLSQLPLGEPRPISEQR